MKKWGFAFIGILACIALLRYTGYTFTSNQSGNSPALDLSSIVEEVEETGNIFDFNEFYVDIQKVEWNFRSITNSLKAQNGSSYTEYTWYPTTGQTPSGTIVIENTDGYIVGHFSLSTEYKPSISSSDNIIDWVRYISHFILYIGRVFVNLGEILIDLLLSVLMALIKFVVFVFHICFRFT